MQDVLNLAKIELLDRITNRVLAQDVIDIDGNVVMKEGTLLTKDKVDLLAPVFQAGAHTMDIKTNDFLNHMDVFKCLKSMLMKQNQRK